MLPYFLLLIAATDEPPPFVPTPPKHWCRKESDLASADCPMRPEVPLPREYYDRDYARVAVVRGNPASWATLKDYPATALEQRREGLTVYRLSIGPDGRAMKCEITQSSGSPDLDDATCANIVRRARFMPALDKSGNPIIGYYENQMRWILPTGENAIGVPKQNDPLQTE
jgi:periplasmic protein TonB